MTSTNLDKGSLSGASITDCRWPPDKTEQQRQAKRIVDVMKTAPIETVIRNDEPQSALEIHNPCGKKVREDEPKTSLKVGISGVVMIV